MPESANDHTSKRTIRKTVEEGTRYLPGRVRDLPNIAVRTTVIGVGKLLHVTDRVRTEYGEARRNGVAPTLERLGRDGAHFLRASLPIGGSTHTPGDTQSSAASSRTVTPPPTVAEPPPATPVTPAEPSEPTPASPPEPSTEAMTPEAAEPPPAHEELPLANYDELTVASLRARLRNLNISDLGKLLAYERAHQDRQNVVTMFENRILKLEREQGR